VTTFRSAFLLLALSAAALLLALPATAQRRQSGTQATASVTRVTVLAGKPTEFRFKLSKAKVRRGIVIFKVVNRGAIVHDFKIRGKKTKLLAPGKAATLRVVFTKVGRYAYVCTVTGHAAAGMKGRLRVVK
jgi:uncharacterized cupredoxin-like copper-binding protein